MFNKRSGVWASIVLAALLLSACSRVNNKKIETSANSQNRSQALTARKLYRYSVVPGGVYSGDELAASRRADPVVRAHYADFRSTASVISLPADAFVYVSYRKANRVYWSSGKHKIPKGERVLTDGENLARTRCGNRLSYTPMQPTLNLGEPGAQALDSPEDPPLAYLREAPLLFPEGGLPDLTLPGQTVMPKPGSSGASPAAVPAELRAANDFAGAGYFPQLFPVAASAPLFALPPAATPGAGGGTGTGGDIGPIVLTPGIPASGPEPAAIYLVLAAAVVFSLRRLCLRS